MLFFASFILSQNISIKKHKNNIIHLNLYNCWHLRHFHIYLRPNRKIGENFDEIEFY